MIKNNHLLIPILFVTALLSACGGGSSNDSEKQTEPPIPTLPQSFTSNFITTLIIDEKTEGKIESYKINNQITTEKDQKHAYTVITTLGNTLQTGEGSSGTIIYPSLSQTLRFELEKNKLILEISYNPLLKEFNQFSIIKIDPSNSYEQFFRCDGNQFNEVCKTISILYDNNTAKVDLSFNKAEFKSINGAEHTFTLNGKLQGNLSVAPQTVQNIPKVSQGSITIDNHTHQMISAVYTPQKIEGPNFFNEGISVLLDNGNNISFTDEQEVLQSQYLSHGLNVDHAFLENSKNLTSKKTRHSIQFSLIPSLFKTHEFGLPTSPTFMISGNIEAPLAQQTLSFSPKASSTPTKDKDNPWYNFFNYTYTPDDFSIRVINHNTVEIENNKLIATIQDKKVKSLKLNNLVWNLDDSSSITQLIYLDYQCGDTAPACAGISVEPNGFGVKFNNTTLTNMETHDPNDENPLPPAILLNGGLVYVGR